MEQKVTITRDQLRELFCKCAADWGRKNKAMVSCAAMETLPEIGIAMDKELFVKPKVYGFKKYATVKTRFGVGVVLYVDENLTPHGRQCLIGIPDFDGHDGDDRIIKEFPQYEGHCWWIYEDRLSEVNEVNKK